MTFMNSASILLVLRSGSPPAINIIRPDTVKKSMIVSLPTPGESYSTLYICNSTCIQSFYYNTIKFRVNTKQDGSLPLVPGSSPDRHTNPFYKSWRYCVPTRVLESLGAGIAYRGDDASTCHSLPEPKHHREQAHQQ